MYTVFSADNSLVKTIVLKLATVLLQVDLELDMGGI
jgi:hypothetical protein